MSLYYSLLFIVLVIETIVFALLAVPLPTRVRRPLTKALSMPFTSPTLQTVIKVILGFVLVLFFDSINKVYQISKEYEHVKAVGFAHDRTEILSRQFLAQRNMYLTGITLFLTFTIVRTFNLVLELFALKEANAHEGISQESVDEEERLSKLIREKDDEIKLLKEQADALAKEI